jgi:hypothetical protein
MTRDHATLWTRSGPIWDELSRHPASLSGAFDRKTGWGWILFLSASCAKVAGMEVGL